MSGFYPNYFTSDPKWHQYWLSDNSFTHEIRLVETANCKATCYIYPDILGLKFVYCPRIPEYKNEIIFDKTEILKLIEKIKITCKDCYYLKFDCNDVDFQAINLLKAYNKSDKQIYFLQTMTLDLGILLDKKQDLKQEFDTNNLQDFLNFSQPFWKTTSDSTRAKTRHSTNRNFEISTEKSSQNIAVFDQIYQQTVARQDFVPHSKEHYHKLINLDFSHLITIYKDKKPMVSWLGIQTENTITHLHGGNTEESFKDYAPYLANFLGIYLSYSQNCRFYDMGGYNPAKGFGKFKDNYKGKIRHFEGPFDILKTIYCPIQTAIKIKNLIQNYFPSGKKV
jgi:lipid II:glycine glycyltransferase (peptidoglycan interpeptide bridge formation enzyme)